MELARDILERDVKLHHTEQLKNVIRSVQSNGRQFTILYDTVSHRHIKCRHASISRIEAISTV